VEPFENRIGFLPVPSAMTSYSILIIFGNRLSVTIKILFLLSPIEWWLWKKDFSEKVWSVGAGGLILRSLLGVVPSGGGFYGAEGFVQAGRR
jgi:hypothetical protein